MKKNDPELLDELRPEYTRSDFGELVRDKYAARLAAETNVVVPTPRARHGQSLSGKE